MNLQIAQWQRESIDRDPHTAIEPSLPGSAGLPSQPLNSTRIPCANGTVSASFRPQRALRHVPGNLIDFGRHGAALWSSRPLAPDTLGFLNLRFGDVTIRDLVCRVSNCARRWHGPGDQYRCGLSFRLAAPEQFDARETFQLITRLEALLRGMAPR